MWEQIKEATSQDLVWPREEEDHYFGNLFKHLIFVG